MHFFLVCFGIYPITNASKDFNKKIFITLFFKKNAPYVWRINK